MLREYVLVGSRLELFFSHAISLQRGNWKSDISLAVLHKLCAKCRLICPPPPQCSIPAAMSVWIALITASARTAAFSSAAVNVPEHS